MQSSINYNGRQVDIEILKSVTVPGNTETTPGLTSAPKRVTGIEKLLQRYVNLILCGLGSVKFAEEQGAVLSSRIVTGTVGSVAMLRHLFTIASESAIERMQESDNDTDFGSQPDDEKISAATVEDVVIDYGTSSALVTVEITTAAGTVSEFVVPIA